MRVLAQIHARLLVRSLAVIATVLAIAAPAGAGTRLKDILDIEGVRENQLLGYGVVTGLNGTGDSLRNCAFTRQSLESMMERLGINTRNSTLNTANAAAVMVTANLPPFATSGSRIDVTVSAMCDARCPDSSPAVFSAKVARLTAPWFKSESPSRLLAGVAGSAPDEFAEKNTSALWK